MSNLTFLTQEQCFGSEQLDILQKRGRRAAITDFSILLGGFIGGYDARNGDGSRAGIAGGYWTKSDHKDSDVNMVIDDGYDQISDARERGIGARPVLPFSSISSIPTNEVGGTPKRARDGILEVEYGYYPQKAVSRDMQEKLERAFKRGSLSRTGKKYTTDSRKNNEYDKVFLPKQHKEFELDGKRYVRVKANFYLDDEEFKLSNGENYKNGDHVWVEVAPVKWLVDEKTNMMLTDKLIFAGVQFNHIKDYHTKDFERTDIKTFMDTYLSKELEQSRETLSLHTGIEAQQFAQDNDGLEEHKNDKIGEDELLDGLSSEELENRLNAINEENAKKQETIEEYKRAILKTKIKQAMAKRHDLNIKLDQVINQLNQLGKNTPEL